MRVVALHHDVIVFVSDVWQTTATALRAGEEGFLIDSPVYPEELRAVPEVLEQAGFPVSGLLATHGDWDHLLGRLAFPGASLGCAESTAARLGAEPGQAKRSLRSFDAEHYVPGRGALSLGGLQPLPVPGRLEVGSSQELELHQTGGHTADGAAFLIPWAGVLVCGDYLSPVEIPMISAGGSLEGYVETLARLAGLLDRAETVVPGHGAPLDTADARRLLDEDAAYLDALRTGDGAATLPDRRATRAQQRIHAENLDRLGLTGGQSHRP
jgi:glyoxylase-like metal-dependent hydrolase (beta-lactamase superfamily II)